MNHLLKFFSQRENIALFLSVLSILITVFNVIHKIYSERINLSATSYFFETIPGQSLVILDLGILNNSSRAISISRMSLEVSRDEDPDNVASGICFGTNQILKEIKTISKGAERIKEVVRSSTLPIHLLAYGSIRGKYVFEFEKIVPMAIPYHNCQIVLQTTDKFIKIPLDLLRVIEEQEQLRPKSKREY